jgi:putative membrane protein
MIEALPVLALLAASASGYAAAVRRIWRRRGRRVLPPARAACFALGLAVLAVALAGPLDEAADERLSLHMVQHTLLIVVAAPLLVLGRPLSALVLALAPAQRRRTTTPLLRSAVMRFALRPATALVAFTVVLCGSHLPAVYDAALANRGLHDVEHLAYLLTAVLFWTAVLGADLGPVRLGHPGRLLYLFAAMATMAVVGATLTMSRRPLYAHYVAEARVAGYRALTDQHTGGVIMWTAGMFTVVPMMAAVVLAWLAEDERRTVGFERRQELRHSG